MTRRIALLLLLARIGLYDWLGSPWRVVGQIMLPPLYVLILPVLMLWNGLEQPAVRLAVADVGAINTEIRPHIRAIDWVIGARMDENEAMRRLEQSQYDAVLVPRPEEAADGGPVPLDLRVRDTDFFLWGFFESVLEGNAAARAEGAPRVLLDPVRVEDAGTPPGIVAGFLAVLSIFGAVGVLQQVHADRLSGWGGFLRIAPISTGMAMTGLGLGRFVVNLVSTIYMIILIDLIVGLPAGTDMAAFAAAVVLVGMQFGLIGVVLGVWIPAYRGSAEMSMQLIWPVLMLPTTIFFDAASIAALKPLVLANPTTPAYDLLRVTLGAEPTVYGAGAAWGLTLAWTAAVVGLTALRGVVVRRAEARA